MATEKLDFFGIQSESSKITRSHSRHFLALSFLFILPFSLSLLAFPTLEHLVIINTHISQPIHLIFLFLYAFILVTLYLCAAATITYSFYHAYLGRPVKFVYTIKSLWNSFIRLFATFICALVIVLAGLIGVGEIVYGVIRGIEHLGFQFEYSSTYFETLKWIGSVILGFGLLYINVNWVLAPVIVVVESSWGLEPLRRSAYLVKGRRGVVVRLLLYFASITWLPVFVSWGPSTGSGSLSGSILAFLFFPFSLTGNTMLYINCKALQGELAEEDAGEFAGEYVSLPLDGENASHLSSLEYVQ